jgi:hypothetical protein
MRLRNVAPVNAPAYEAVYALVRWTAAAGYMDGKIFSAMRQALIIPGPGRLGAWRLTVQRRASNANRVGVAARSESLGFPAHRLRTHCRIPNGHQEKMSFAE